MPHGKFDSIASPKGPTGPNAQSVLDVYRTLQRMTERWNAHDLEGYLDYFWKSPDLLGVRCAAVFWVAGAARHIFAEFS